jgi:hypothetical protein
VFHEQFSAVILLNDPFGKTQAKAPAPFFCGKTRFKNPGNILLADALTRIRYVN